MEAGKIVSSQSKMGRDRNKYTAAEKLKVIKYMRRSTVTEQPVEEPVGESSIREWRKKTRLEKIPRGKAACHGKEVLPRDGRRTAEVSPGRQATRGGGIDAAAQGQDHYQADSSEKLQSIEGLNLQIFPES